MTPPTPTWRPFPPPQVQPLFISWLASITDDRDRVLKQWKQSLPPSMEKINSDGNTVIPEVTRSLKTVLDSLPVLSELHSKLSSVSVDNSKDLWMQVAECKSVVHSAIEHLHKCNSGILKQKVKRNRRRRKRRRFVKEEEEERLSVVDKACSEWLKNKQSEQMRKRLEESVEKEASGSLGEVRKKIQDLESTENLLTALKELREHRSMSKKWKIDGPPAIEADQRFTRLCSEIEELVSAQLKIYQDEEYALKVMMSEQVDAKMRTAAQSVRSQSSGDPIKDYYYQATRDVTSFVGIRQQWDRYLAPHGSTIPIDWVTPTSPSNSVWASYLSDNHHVPPT